MNEEQKIMRKYILKHKIFSILLLITIVGFTGGYFFVDYGFLNNSYLASRDFSRAFTARQVGNCDEFIKYAYEGRPEWRRKCLDERSNEIPVISQFKINKIQVSDDTAFLSVELKRKEDFYSVNYTMTKVYNPFPFVMYKLDNPKN